MIQVLAEPIITDFIQHKISILLEEAFPDFFNGRTYFKQLPHFRILYDDDDDLVAHVALDYRVIRIGDQVHRILGVADLCVRKDRRGCGLGSRLLREAEDQARHAHVPFMVLMSDKHDFYCKHGFRRIQPAMTKWLAIEGRASHSLTEQDLSDCFMVKSLMGLAWPLGVIDMLGYLF